MERGLVNRDWKSLTFNDIVSSLKRGPFGSNLKKSFFVPTGYKVYEQQNAINDDYTLGTYCINEEKYEELKSFEVGPGDYIVSCSGTIGRLSRLPKEAPKGVINQALLKITLNENIIHHKYFFYLFRSQSFLNLILKDARGTGIKNLAGITELRAVPINLPPKSEQQKIVGKIDECLSELDNGISNLKLAQEQFKVYRQAVLKKAFEGELTKSKVVMVQRKIGDFAELITKGASPKWQGFNYVSDESQLLFITSENVREGFLDLTKKKFLPLEFNEKQKRSILKKGDVLFNLVGASIGRAAIFNQDILSNINQAVAIIRLTYDLNNSYLTYFLNAEIAKQNYLNKVVDVARANLSLTDVNSLTIPYCSLSEQQTIVQEIETRLSVCDKIEQDIEVNLEKAEALRQSILKKAFEGKLLNEKELAEV